MVRGEESLGEMSASRLPVASRLAVIADLVSAPVNTPLSARRISLVERGIDEESEAERTHREGDGSRCAADVCIIAAISLTIAGCVKVVCC